MTRRKSIGLVCGMLLIGVAGSLIARPVNAQDKPASSADKIPAKVMNGLNQRFPKAEIQKWTREKEGEIVVYDIEFKQNNRRYEADIEEDGTIYNSERAIEEKDLPAAVRKSVEKKYPGSIMKEIMGVTTVGHDKEELESFEIVLTTIDKKEIEITVAPGGRILEDAGNKK